MSRRKNRSGNIEAPKEPRRSKKEQERQRQENARINRRKFIIGSAVAVGAGAVYLVLNSNDEEADIKDNEEKVVVDKLGIPKPADVATFEPLSGPLEEFAKKDITLALRAFIQTKFQDPSTLLSAGSKLPQTLKDEWAKTVRELHKALPKFQLENDRSTSGALLFCVRHLNETFCAKHGCIILEHTILDYEKRQQTLSTEVQRLTERHRYDFEGGDLNAYFTRKILKNEYPPIIAFKGNLDCVLVSEDGIDFRVSQMSGVGTHDSRDIVVESDDAALANETLRFFRKIWDRYRNESVIHDVYRNAVICEEVRHGIDAKLSPIAALNGMDVDDVEPMISSMLTKQSVLRQRFLGRNFPTKTSDVAFLNDAFYEFSGWMTTAAVGPDPNYSFIAMEHEFRVSENNCRGTRTLREAIALGKETGHSLGMSMGVSKIGMDLGIMNELVSLDAPHNYLQLFATINRLKKMPTRQIRLTVKNSINPELTFPVDAPPFSKISEEGELVPQESR